MYRNYVFILIGVLSLTFPCNGSKILGIFPMPSRSHYILGSALMRGLAEAGHDVTIISPFSEKNPPKRGSYRDIVLKEIIEEYEDLAKPLVGFDDCDKNSTQHWISAAWSFGSLLSAGVLNHTNVVKLIKSGEKFDVVIAGQYFNDAVKALATVFNSHLILFSSIGPNTMLNSLVGNPVLPSHVPEIFTDFPPKMTFFQRLLNTLTKLGFSFIINYLHYPIQKKVVENYFPGSVNFYDALQNVSLVLLNSHISITNAQSYVPCMIDIGGFHISPPKKLPNDLQTFLDNAKDGVIYMSMGSNIKSKDMPAEKRDAILKAFGKLKQKVLWKWEDDILPGQPSNVKLGKWLPQQDILAHPNVKLFITHGGLLSTTETVYNGVPIIAIPIFGDQTMNAYTAQRAGYGIVLEFKDITEETLSSRLNEVLNNPKYRKEAQRRSGIIKDRLMSPIDTAVYWVEYVIRHNGAKHLRVAYLDLAWYQFYLLDVFAFIFAVPYGIYLLLKKVFSYLCRRKDNKQKKQKLKQN